MPSLRGQGKTTVSGTYTYHWNSESYFFSNCVYVGRHSYWWLKSYFLVQRLFILSLGLLKCARFEVLTEVLKISRLYYWNSLWGKNLVCINPENARQDCRTLLAYSNGSVIGFIASHPTYWYRRSVIEGANIRFLCAPCCCQVYRGGEPSLSSEATTTVFHET